MVYDAGMNSPRLRTLKMAVVLIQDEQKPL
jgi:hypothetical protein